MELQVKLLRVLVVVLVAVALHITKVVKVVVLELQIKVMQVETEPGNLVVKIVAVAAVEAAKEKLVILTETNKAVTDCNGMTAQHTLAAVAVLALQLETVLVVLVVEETHDKVLMIMQVVLNQVRLTQVAAVEEIHRLVETNLKFLVVAVLA